MMQKRRWMFFVASKAGLIACVTLLAGCVTVDTVKMGDGQPAYALDCSAFNLNWQSCYEKIGSICGANGYEVIASSLDGQVIRGKEPTYRTMKARCKA